MTTYAILGYSYSKGYYVRLDNIEAKSERAALLKARKQYDAEGAGYHDFIAKPVA